jgi:hypothetical protein
MENPGGNVDYILEEDGKKTIVVFNKIEVEGHEPLFSRYFYSRIWRKGGVQGKRDTLAEIAEKLGWSGPPEDLLGSWEGEETEEEADARVQSNR